MVNGEKGTITKELGAKVPSFAVVHEGTFYSWALEFGHHVVGGCVAKASRVATTKGQVETQFGRPHYSQNSVEAECRLS